MNSQTLLDVAAFLTKQAEQLRMAERLGMANGETSAPDPAPFGRYASGEPKPAPAYDACKPLWEAAQRAGVFDTMVIGHWHTYQPGDRIITNGSLIGYNEYADRSNFAFEYPRQAMWMVHPERGITYHIPVHVEEPKTAAQGSQWVAWLEAA